MDTSDLSTESPHKQLPPIAYAICFWPLGLTAIGGLVGGLLGGAASSLNLLIYKSKLPRSVKIVCNIAAGVIAICGWLAIALAINRLRS